MRKLSILITFAATLLYVPVVMAEEVREYWGAYVEAGDYWPTGQVYGVSWNYPSPEEALNRAMEECLKQPRCVDIHDYNVFSTSLEKGYDSERGKHRSDVFHTDYGNIKANLNKVLCIQQFSF